MSEALLIALNEQLPRILEEAAFILVEDREAPLPEAAPAVEASLRFSGAQRGTCFLAVSLDGANHLAKEMLGDELAGGGNLCEQATAELLNMLTAWLLDTWWGEAVEHQMSTPSTVRERFDKTVAWSLPTKQRVVMSTDAGYTFICGVVPEV